MALLQGTITDTGQIVLIDVPTTRIPERQKIEEIADDDKILIWDKDENLTKEADISQIRDKINGSAIPETPAVQNGIIYYKVPAAQNESTRIDIPALAGKVYEFERRPYGAYQPDEYNVLSTGGIELTQEGDKFYTGDRLAFKLIQYQAGGGAPGNGGGASGFVFKAIVTIPDSMPLTIDHMGKLINVSGGSNKVILLLPDITTVPENSVIAFETMINNQWQTTIQTSTGQNIYFRGSSLAKVYMGLSEVLWLQAGADGWYVINSDGFFLEVGQILLGHSNTLNTIIGEGQLLKRESYPRLWEYVQATGTSLVTDVVWKGDDSNPLTRNNYRGCFSSGDETGTTFRVPDLRGTFPRFLDRGRGLDLNGRVFSNSGGYQTDQVGELNVSLIIPKGDSYNGDPYDSTRVGRGQDGNPRGNYIFPHTFNTGKETTVKNTGLLGLIRI